MRSVPIRHVAIVWTAVCMLAFLPAGGFRGTFAGAQEAGTGLPAFTADPGKTVRNPLSLDECLRIALENNPDIGARLGIVDAARAGVDEATGQRWPSLNALGRYAHYLDPQRLVPARKLNEAGAYSEDILGGDLVMRMPLYTGGRITNEIRASEAVQLSTEERLVRARQELVFDVSRVFFFMLGQRHVIESVAFSKKTLEQHRERIVALMEAKRAARVDRLRLDVRLSSVKQTLVQEKNILDIQQRLLANLLGIKTEAGVDVKGALELDFVNTDLNQSLEKAQRNRSDYKAVLAEVEAQTRRVDVARAGNRPSVFLEGAYGGRWAVGSVEKGLDDSASEQVGQAGIVVNIPIFEGGRVSARIRQEQARLRTAEENLRKVALQVRLDVETAILNIQSNLERVSAMEAAILEGKESLQIETEKYDMGRASITDVLDAQSALLEAQTQYYLALTGYNASIAQLHLAVGDEP